MNNREISLEEFKKFMPEMSGKDGLAILDVGCGGNWHGTHFRQMGFQWIGFDKHEFDDVNLRGEMENIPLHSNMIDVVFCSHAFEHTTNPIQTLKEFHRVLRPQSILFLSMPYYCRPQVFNIDSTHLFVLTDLQMVNLLQKNSFGILKSYVATGNNEKEQDWSYIIIGIKV